MKGVIQRVSRASLTVRGETVASIGKGLAVLVGFHKEDKKELLEKFLDKVLKLRIFEDAPGRMNLSVSDVGGEIMLIPQFTLYGDTQKGNRPSFVEAAGPEAGRELFNYLVTLSRAASVPVKAGIFQETMSVELVNEGPVTILMEVVSKPAARP